jgi:hypothetical protein
MAGQQIRSELTSDETPLPRWQGGFGQRGRLFELPSVRFGQRRALFMECTERRIRWQMEWNRATRRELSMSACQRGKTAAKVRSESPKFEPKAM